MTYIISGKTKDNIQSITKLDDTNQPRCEILFDDDTTVQITYFNSKNKNGQYVQEDFALIAEWEADSNTITEYTKSLDTAKEEKVLELKAYTKSDAIKVLDLIYNSNPLLIHNSGHTRTVFRNAQIKIDSDYEAVVDPNPPLNFKDHAKNRISIPRDKVEIIFFSLRNLSDSIFNKCEDLIGDVEALTDIDAIDNFDYQTSLDAEYSAAKTTLQTDLNV